MGKEILTRFNPKVQTYADSGHGHGSLLVTDVMAACANSNKLGLNILIGSICGDRSCQDAAFYPLYRYVVELATEGLWQIPRGSERLRSLTNLAIFESCHLQTCPTCKGTGFSKTNISKKTEVDKSKTCLSCRGTGQFRISDSQRAQAIGIKRQAWSKTWQIRYDEIIFHIDNQEHKAIREIYKLMLD